MKVETYWFTLDYGNGNTFTFFNLSRVAVKDYWKWYEGRAQRSYGRMAELQIS